MCTSLTCRFCKTRLSVVLSPEDETEQDKILATHLNSDGCRIAQPESDCDWLGYVCDGILIHYFERN